MYTYINGKITKKTDISIFDRGFLYGDGAFESLRTYKGIPFLLDQHLKRLSETCIILKIPPPKDIFNIINKLMRKNHLKEAYIKIIVTRGESKEHGLSPKKASGKPTLIIICKKIKDLPINTLCKAIVYKKPRTSWIGSRLKTLNYLENILAKIAADKALANEALFQDEKGNILEGTVSNVFIVKNGVLITSPLSMPILPGVTRNYIIKLAKKLKIKVFEKNFKKKDLKTADESFITSSGPGIIPINKKAGLITKKLMEEYGAKI
ncbi:MAG: aminotransferase class IV [Candidatus Saganbacteria bacterium]|nr:aminotransferase class IV [Candidatus Saganbacteria bacterium]